MLAHLVGVAADIVSGRMDNASRPEWTRPQVESRAGRAPSALAQEWDEAAPEVARRLAAREIGLPPMWDALTHEADLREAHGLGTPPDDAVAPALDAVCRQLARGYADTEGGLLLRAGGKQWRFGTGQPQASVEVAPYELFRAVFSRRSRAQVRAWPWEGDPSDHADQLPIFGPREDDQPIPD